MAVIVVAEDDKAPRRLVVAALTKSGHTVIQASDGIRARTVLDDNPNVDVLVTDAVMPMLDGRELVLALRREDRWKDLPILMMSAHAGVKEISRLLDAGVSRFLAKPVKPATLMAEIGSLISDGDDVAANG